ncbi:MAG: UPF0158 family protein [Anaerolineae bacterium]|nr:UPF0158 family protein [Anaerolineae bacterium]
MELRINFADLKAAFESSRDEASYYLNLITGAIESIPLDLRWQLESLLEEHNYDIEAIEEAIELNHDLSEHELLKAAARIELGEEADFLAIPSRPAYDGYNEMKAFIGRVDDDWLRENLEFAIQGESPFRRFYDVLAADPDALEHWYGFTEERLIGRMLDWLDAKNIEFVED